MAQGDGLKKCDEAFNRLVNGKPNISKHVGISLEKITKSIVSVEAGFDPGYLKSDRPQHMPLLARIASCQTQNSENEAGVRERLRRAKNKAKKLSVSESNMKVTLDLVLTQNLMLVERVRELEEELRRIGNVKKIKDNT